MRSLRVLVAAGLLIAGVARAQEIQLGDGLPGASAHKQHVELETASVRVKAGQSEWVELRFLVGPGLHINSHTPHDELLVPTALSMDTAAGVKVLAQRYPSGIPLHLDVGSGEVLSTYQGEFRVEMQVTVAKGTTVLSGTLRYQACDAHACFPPRSLPVRVGVTGE